MTDSLFSPLLWTQLRALRRTLHECAELAHAEVRTASVMHSFVAAYGPDMVLTELGGHGLAAVFEGPEPGRTVLVRCELDALPKDHSDDLAMHRDGAEHRCGHDGHMAVVAGLAPLYGFNRPKRGRVVLAFQSAEETGEGAMRMLEDPRFSQIRPDYALAFHNLPGFPLATVVARENNFASASVGMEVSLEGKASHAAEPENAIRPTETLSQLLRELPAMSEVGDDPLRMITITHAHMGELSFGITPGYANLWATLRADSSEGLSALSEAAEGRVMALAHEAGLLARIDWHPRFPPTRSDPALTRQLESVCEDIGLNFRKLEVPFRWSEDFGHFADVCPSLYFGIGIGEEAPRLHQPAYAFHDDIISPGVRVFHAMTERLTTQPRN